MKFTTVLEKEFEDFSTKHPCGTFHQMPGWGKLKERYGWSYHIVGMKEGNELVAAALILEKHLFGPYCLFYSPRGFLLDYQNHDLLETFTKEVKNFAKKHKAVFVKIDPYIIHHERSIDGTIIDEGIDNASVIDELKRLGYRHKGFSLGMEDLQPRWAFALYFNGRTKDELLNNLESKTRQLIRKNKKVGIVTRELKVDEIDVFKNIMQHTADRRHFIDRPVEYYQSMLECLGENVKIIVAELDLENYLNQLDSEIEDNRKVIKDKEADIENKKSNLNLVKTQKRMTECQETILRLEKRTVEVADLYTRHGKVITLGGIIFMSHGTEMLSLFGGAYKEFMDFLSPYTTNWNMIEYAYDHGYEKYNFYGIGGNVTDKKDELYGLYDFKRGFGGVVDEYIGEFDLIINAPLYHLYNIAFSIYDNVKNLGRR